MKRRQAVAVIAAVALLAATGLAEIHTVGHLEEDGGTQSWLETWDVGFSTRQFNADVGEATWTALGHSPHAGLDKGELIGSSAGAEFLMIGDDGYGVVMQESTAPPRLGGDALSFLRGSIDHVAGSGLQTVRILDLSEAEGNEIVTIANDGIMEIWDYDETLGVKDRGQLVGFWASVDGGSRPKDTGQLYDGYSRTNKAFDGSAIGDFDPNNEGLEVALLRADGFLDIWDFEQTGSWPATQPQRLAISHLPGTSGHEPWDHFFSGELDDSNPGHEVATIGSDGVLEIYNPMTGAVLSSSSNAYDTSAHDPFLTVTADLGIAVERLVGDANLDGVVNDADLSLLLASWNQDRTGDPDGGWGNGEFDGTAPVQDADLSLLLANWTGAGAVPEPATLTVLALGGLAVLRRRR